jgi:AmiR/NasT family two-component response regulator
MTDLLIVEDDALIRHAFGALLRAEGYTVRAVSNAKMAFDALGQQMPALVLMDVGLPDMDGIECARILRQRRLGSPIIFLTAYGGPDFVARAIEHEPYAYLVKPITGEQLVPLVRSALHATKAVQAKEDKLLTALSDSREISAAVGMLAERNEWSVDEAFAALRLMARSEGMRIVDLAAQITTRSR